MWLKLRMENIKLQGHNGSVIQTENHSGQNFNAIWKLQAT